MDLLLWRDIITAAGNIHNILFPIFTNGTFMDEDHFRLFARCRNLIPVMSIEGNHAITDRRGDAVQNLLKSGNL